MTTSAKFVPPRVLHFSDWPEALSWTIEIGSKRSGCFQACQSNTEQNGCLPLTSYKKTIPYKRSSHCLNERTAAFMHSPGSGGLSGLCRVTDHLYISNYKAANDSTLVSRCRITCIVNVTETESRCAVAPEVDVVHIPISDTPSTQLVDHFDKVADKIQVIAAGGGRTLVHCNAGVSRSATLCMAYLVKHQGATLLEAHRWLKACRPMVRPNVGFWKQLICYERSLRGCNSVHMVASSMGEIPDIYQDEARNMLPL